MSRQGLVVIGRVGRPHGVTGEIRLTATGPTLAHVGPGDAIDLRDQGGMVVAFRVQALRPVSGALLVRLDGVHDREAAAALTGREVVVDASRLAVLAEPDEFYVRDLIGCAVGVASGPLGTVIDVHEGAANDALVVRRPAGPEVLIPFTRDAVVSVDLAGRTVTIRPDLLDDQP